MKPELIGSGVAIGMLVSALWLHEARAQDAGGTTTSAAPTAELKPSESAVTNSLPARRHNGKTARNAGAVAEHSAGVDEVLRMLRAGVSKDVIKTYIENSSTPYHLTADDIIALKDHAVPDDLTSAMLKRSGTLRAQAAQPAKPAAMLPAYSGGNRLYGGLDPQSYEYFQYYYLYPRTLAAANQRLFTPYPSSRPLAPYAYGLYGPMPFGPLPPSAFSHP